MNYENKPGIMGKREALFGNRRRMLFAD